MRTEREGARPVPMAYTMSSAGRRLATSATRWMDTLWDPAARLLRYPPTTLASPSHQGRTHAVRETSWYALGLLVRGAQAQGSQDVKTAVEALDSVLRQQYIAPGTPYHGTWRRSPQEQPPPADPVLWDDYDPNWREFVGCTLLLILAEFGTALPYDLIRRIEQALDLAALGARERAVSPRYSNIALMSAYLMDTVGRRRGDPALARTGELLGEQVFDIWAETRTFAEFNSPTYYGVDLFALALWRDSPSPVLRKLGAQMENGLWAEIASLYHPGLRNMAGPYDRAYGMDLCEYVSLLGQWIALATGMDHAPLPAGDPSRATHAHDLCFAPCFALLGVRPEAAERLAAFAGSSEPRWVTTTISNSPSRVATSWIGPHHMIGAQDTGGAKTDANDQYHPVTVHWNDPDDGINWLRVMPSDGVEAAVTEDGVLDITSRGPLRFEVRTGGSVDVDAAGWRFPGLTVRIPPVAGTAVTPAVTTGAGLLYIDFPGPLRISLEISPN